MPAEVLRENTSRPAPSPVSTHAYLSSPFHTKASRAMHNQGMSRGIPSSMSHPARYATDVQSTPLHRDSLSRGEYMPIPREMAYTAEQRLTHSMGIANRHDVSWDMTNQIPQQGDRYDMTGPGPCPPSPAIPDIRPAQINPQPMQAITGAEPRRCYANQGEIARRNPTLRVSGVRFQLGRPVSQPETPDTVSADEGAMCHWRNQTARAEDPNPRVNDQWFASPGLQMPSHTPTAFGQLSSGETTHHAGYTYQQDYPSYAQRNVDCARMAEMTAPGQCGNPGHAGLPSTRRMDTLVNR